MDQPPLLPSRPCRGGECRLVAMDEASPSQYGGEDTGVGSPGPGRRSRPRGFTLTEVVVVLALVSIVALLLLMAVPRGREGARLAACQRNLAQIGAALAMYDQGQGHLPTLATPTALDQHPDEGHPSVPRILLEQFGLSDFRGLEVGQPIRPTAGPVPGEIPVPGFVCGSDPMATASAQLRAPISYRATTGDSASGDNGPFAPGRKVSMTAIESTDGTGYTSGLAERLVGDGAGRVEGPRNYVVHPGPVGPEACPKGDRAADWRTDAGTSWFRADYRSTLYNHALRPGEGPSCVAVDGQTAVIGASSGHVRGLNLLMLDGSVKLVLGSISPAVWREYAAIRPTETPAIAPGRKVPAGYGPRP